MIRGEIELEDAKTGYRETLAIVLDEVELLLENADIDSVVISADHGEALGEDGVYGHPADMYLNSLIRVPWVTTCATDEETRQPTDHRYGTEKNIEERLRALGYR